MKKWLPGVLALAILIAVGVFAYYKWTQWMQHQTEMRSQVLLEQVKHVSKLITVEGHFSEIVDYKDYWGVDWLPFQKKALVRAQATVSAGFDLQKMSIELDEKNKVVSIRNVPQPEILSVEHDLDYYDLSEGAFNSFSREDYNKVNAYVKQQIVDKAEKSSLLQEAKSQGMETLQLIEMMAEAAGFTVVYKDQSPTFLD